jgi:hypothetical protein
MKRIQKRSVPARNRNAPKTANRTEVESRIFFDEGFNIISSKAALPADTGAKTTPATGQS